MFNASADEAVEAFKKYMLENKDDRIHVEHNLHDLLWKAERLMSIKLNPLGYRKEGKEVWLPQTSIIHLSVPIGDDNRRPNFMIAPVRLKHLSRLLKLAWKLYWKLPKKA